MGDSSPTVGSEHCHVTCNQYAALGSHHADLATTPLVARATASRPLLFKIAVLAFGLAGQAPSYLADDCQLVSDARPRRLRSSDSLTCAVRRTWNTYSDRCFVAAAPRVCTSLPAELRQCDSFKQFRRLLKTYFFRDMGPRCSVTFS